MLRLRNRYAAVPPNRRHTMSETVALEIVRTAGAEHAHEGRGRDEDDRRRKKIYSVDRSSIGGGGVKLARGESSERTFLSFFLSFLSTFSPSSRSMRDAITVQLAHAISSRRCLLPSYLFFWPPEAAPSRPPLPPLAAAILVISGETQLRYFAPDLGFHSIPLGREPR